MRSALGSAFRFNLEKALSQTPLFKTERDRRLFWGALLLNLIAFGVFLTHHMLHNHSPRFPWIDETDQWFAGRWFNFFLIKANYSADMPVLGPLIGILFSVIAGLLTLKLWRLKLTAIEEFIALGMITVFPISLVYFYYTYQTPLFCISLLFSAAAVMLVSRFSFWRLGLGTVCALLAFASYQPSFSVMMTLVISAFIARMIADEDNSPLAASKLAALQASSIVLGAMLYKASLAALNIGDSRTTATVSLNELPDKLAKVVEASFNHLTMTQPDLLFTVKALLAVLLALGVLSSLAKLRRKPVSLLIVAVAWIALVLATKAMFLISADGSFFNYRYNMAMAFLHAFSFAALIHCVGAPVLRSAALALGAFLVLRFVQADLVRQEVLYRGEQHDLALANRLLTRMENLPELDITKTYDLVRIGKYSQFRQNALSYREKKADAYGDTHMDGGEVTDRWADEQVFIMLGSKIDFLYKGPSDPDFMSKAETARATLLAGRKPWPHASSVFIEGQTIYIYMN
ncbi:MAG: glucosyltransferase domain-containing protein [Oricola sp.]|jgi:hypothetical protein|nr:glucosyltransferase domain-containing protein [Oricola sp.]